MDKSEIKIYNGNYDYFQSELSAEKERGEGGGSEIRRINEKAASYFEKKERQSLIRRLRTKIERLEQDISDTENYVRSMESELEQPHVSSDYEKVKDISYKIEQKNSELKVLYEEWEQAYERLHNEEQQATAGD